MGASGSVTAMVLIAVALVSTPSGPPCRARLYINCVPELKGIFHFSLQKNRDNFSRIGPFLMYSSGNESYGHAASYAFEFI